MLLLVIDFPNQYKTINCKSTTKTAFATNGIILSIIHLNRFIDKFSKTLLQCLNIMNLLIKFPCLNFYKPYRL